LLGLIWLEASSQRLAAIFSKTSTRTHTFPPEYRSTTLPFVRFVVKENEGGNLGFSVKEWPFSAAQDSLKLCHLSEPRGTMTLSLRRGMGTEGESKDLDNLSFTMQLQGMPSVLPRPSLEAHRAGPPRESPGGLPYRFALHDKKGDTRAKRPGVGLCIAPVGFQ
jgi:hypothetical protein